MNSFIKYSCLSMCAVACLCLASLGYDYGTIGYGLHPYAAGAGIVVMLTLMLLVHIWSINEPDYYVGATDGGGDITNPALISFEQMHREAMRACIAAGFAGVTPAQAIAALDWQVEVLTAQLRSLTKTATA